MSDNQEQNRPSGRYGKWRERPLIGGPGVGERVRRRALWPPPGTEEEEHAEGMTPEEAGTVSVEALAVGHQPDAANVRPVIGFVIALAVLMGLSVAVVTGMQAFMTGGRAYIGLPPDGIVQRAVDPADRDIPENARARAIPDIELAELRAKEKELLETYGWVDQATGKARIPIERAMELLLQKGLPTRPNAGQSATEPLRPSDSSSGRVPGAGQ